MTESQARAMDFNFANLHSLRKLNLLTIDEESISPEVLVTRIATLSPEDAAHPLSQTLRLLHSELGNLQFALPQIEESLQKMPSADDHAQEATRNAYIFEIEMVSKNVVTQSQLILECLKGLEEVRADKSIPYTTDDKHILSLLAEMGDAHQTKMEQLKQLYEQKVGKEG